MSRLPEAKKREMALIQTIPDGVVSQLLPLPDLNSFIEEKQTKKKKKKKEMGPSCPFTREPTVFVLRISGCPRGQEKTDVNTWK